MHATNKTDVPYNPPFWAAQLDHLNKNNLTSASTTSSHMAQLGTAMMTFVDTNNQGESWIIDFGASDHMSGNCGIFFSLYTVF